MRRVLRLFTSITVLALTACGSETKQNAPTQDFITQLKTDYPVSLTQIADDVWVHSTNYRLPGQSPISSNGLVVADGETLILVDTAWGELATLALLDTLKDKTGKSVSKLIITHHNMDRIAGVDVAERAGIQVFAHPETPRLAAMKGYPVPNTSVAALKDPKSRTKVGAVEVAFPGHGYAQDNLVVYVPSANILYGGSAVKSAGTTNLGRIDGADLKTWAPALAWIKATYPETKIVVPAQGKGANLSLIDGTLSLIAARVNTEAEAVEKSDIEK